ncbi:MAG: allantoinase AllB [Thermomicrobiales bacterium]
MPHYDLLIRHATLATDPTLPRTDLAASDGQIVAIAPELPGTATTEIDATGLHLFPGVIDAHVHFDEPGRTDWEGFHTGSRAFAVGGGTTYFDMPLNAHPPTIDAASFDAKLAAAQASSLTDFALWGGLVPGNLDHLPELAERGVIGFKAFMSRTGTDDFQAADDLTLYEGMARAATLGRLVAVHAENDHLTAALAQRAIAAGRTGVRDYLDSRPAIAELEAITRAITFAEDTGCALHIVHVSTGRGVTLVAAAQAHGIDVTCETCAHYLVFTEEDVERLGAVAKCAPPLRPQAEQDALWSHIATGTLPIITSDHSPAPPSMKEGDNFFTIWGGISGCQSTLPALLTAAPSHDISLPAIAALTATNVARRFALPHKGTLTPGHDADLALIDLTHTSTLQPTDLHYRHQMSPYINRQFHARTTCTILRAQVITHNGKIVAQPANCNARVPNPLLKGRVAPQRGEGQPRQAPTPLSASSSDGLLQTVESAVPPARRAKMRT